MADYFFQQKIEIYSTKRVETSFGLVQKNSVWYNSTFPHFRDLSILDSPNAKGSVFIDRFSTYPDQKFSEIEIL